MAYSLVQSKLATGVSTSVTMNSTPSVGNLMVVMITEYVSGGSTSDHIATPTDNKGNTYSFVDETWETVFNENHVAIFYTIISSSSATFTISFAGGTIAAYEFSGGASSSILDAFNINNGSSTNFNVSLTTTTANCLVVGCFVDYQNGQPYTAGAAYVLGLTELDSNSNERMGSEYDLDGGAAGARNVDMTTTTNSGWAGVAAAFKVAGSSTPVNRRLLLLGVGM